MPKASNSWLGKFKRPHVFIPTLIGLTVAAGFAAYLILLNPGSIFVRWALAALPERITMISMGPYPEEKDFQRLKKERVKYIVSTLDPRLPYENQLIEREKANAGKYGMVLKVFPMASIFDQKIFPDYLEQQQRAVEFLKNIDAPAYLHCYLGKHRTLRVRNALVKAGVPQRYLSGSGTNEQYWDLINRLNDAQREFQKENFSGVLEILGSVTAMDADVANLRGWSHYRLGLVDDAAEDFRQGLKLDPSNPRNLVGLGYCFMRSGQPVMAQRQFDVVLDQFPDNESALVGVGLVYLRLENKAAAAEAFRKVVAMDPGNGEVKGFLKQAESR